MSLAALERLLLQDGQPVTLLNLQHLPQRDVEFFFRLAGIDLAQLRPQKSRRH